ncbi:MAG TPA: ABC transporter permease [Gaiellaceae bacterium]|nr:ABC transporter permease [Gaiellaceae bacterium]
MTASSAVEPGAGAPGPAPAGGEAQQQLGGGLTMQLVRVFVENRLAVVGLAIIAFAIVFCWVGPLFYHTNQTDTQKALLNSIQNAAPSGAHPLGTDASGFDLLGRIMYGGQISLEVGFAAAGIATIVGVLVGAVSGFFGRAIDAVLMRFVDVLLSVPILYLLIVLAVIFTPSVKILILVIGFTAWLVPARLVRGETLSLRVREFVQAVRVMGGGGPRIVLRHIIPNTIGTIIVNATFQVADAILLLAALGFIGLGVPSPQTDWGSMLSNGVNYAFDGYWWEIYPTGLAIVLVVVAFNFVGDALRDAFEVRLQRR